jgi:hypothetical protein
MIPSGYPYYTLPVTWEKLPTTGRRFGAILKKSNTLLHMHIIYSRGSQTICGADQENCPSFSGSFLQPGGGFEITRTGSCFDF